MTTDAHYRRCDDCGAWWPIDAPPGSSVSAGQCRRGRPTERQADGWALWLLTGGDQGCCESTPRELGQVEGSP